MMKAVFSVTRLLTLKMKEGSMSHAVGATSRNWRRNRINSTLEPTEGM